MSMLVFVLAQLMLVAGLWQTRICPEFSLIMLGRLCEKWEALRVPMLSLSMQDACTHDVGLLWIVREFGFYLDFESDLEASNLTSRVCWRK